MFYSLSGAGSTQRTVRGVRRPELVAFHPDGHSDHGAAHRTGDVVTRLRLGQQRELEGLRAGDDLVDGGELEVGRKLDVARRDGPHDGGFVVVRLDLASHSGNNILDTAGRMPYI